MIPLDRSVFLRPIAHRGLHGSGAVENTAPAFEAAIEAGWGVECDVRTTADGRPVVFHDDDLARLTDRQGLVRDHAASDLRHVRHRESGEAILSFAEFLEIAAGRAPVLAEIKSDWNPPDPSFIAAVSEAVRAYKGPLALMSFDPAVLAAMKEAAPDVPRGLASRDFARMEDRDARIDSVRAERLTHFHGWRQAGPSLVAFDVRSLPTPVTEFIRKGLDAPLFAWTVGTPAEWSASRMYADAAIFEGPVPPG